jgi:hypothetical protein
MTTDITELAQREKFEAWAEHACAAPWGYLKKRRTTEGYSEQIYTCMWAAWKAAGAELVEALEKAQNENELARGQLLIAHRTLLKQQQSIADLVTGRQNLQQTMGVYVHAYEEAKGQIAKDVEIKARLCRESNSLFDRLRAAEKRIADLESRTVTVKLPEGDERDDLVISITEEIAHLQRCVERYRKEEMASTTQEMEQRLLVQQIALSVLNSAAGIKWEAE